MKVEQYDALVKLMRGKSDSPANVAARKVLVHGEKATEAIEKSGIKRASVYQAIQRYSSAHERAVQVFQGSDDIGAQFDLIVDLNRGDPKAPSTIKARSVIVDRTPTAQIKLEGISPPALHQAVKRYRSSLEILSNAYPNNDEDGNR